jgi:hypothetical protein
MRESRQVVRRREDVRVPDEGREEVMRRSDRCMGISGRCKASTGKVKSITVGLSENLQ